MLRGEIEYIKKKKKKNQIEPLDMKNTISKMKKKSLGGTK